MPAIRLKAGEHSCVGHLSAPEGQETVENPNQLERDALLVYEGTHESMDGPVTVTPEHIDRLVATHNSYLSRFMRTLNGDVPMQNCPPFQLDHKPEATHTIGRVVGLLRKGVFKNEETGQELTAVYGRTRILGRENVEKVLDGRWTNVSIGADFDLGKFGELSITPFPAATFASLLAARRTKLSTQGEDMTAWQKFTASLKGFFGLSADKDADDKAQKLRAHLMEKEKLSAEEADKKLAAMDEAECKKLAAEVDEKEKLAQPIVNKEEKDESADKENKSDLAAATPATTELAAAPAATPAAVELAARTEAASEVKAKFITLARGFRKTSGEAKLAARRATISSRLMSLRAGAKITPAEIKKIDIERLSAANDATIEEVLKSYESREPVILAGVLGSIGAASVSELSQKVRLANLEAETRKNMSLKNGTAGAKLSASHVDPMDPNAQPQMAGAQPDVNVHIDTTPHEHYDLAYGEICKMMDSGMMLEAKSSLKALLDKAKMGGASGPAPVAMAEEPTGGPSKMSEKLSSLAQKVDTLQTEFEAIVSLVGPTLGVQTSEIEKEGV